MKYRNIKKSLFPFGFLSIFRLLLWWGGQTVQRLVMMKKNRPQISRISRSHSIFPQVIWFRSDTKMYGLVSETGKSEINLLMLQGIHKN